MALFAVWGDGEACEIPEGLSNVYFTCDLPPESLPLF